MTAFANEKPQELQTTDPTSAAGIPPGCTNLNTNKTGGVAALNHRLMAKTPSE